MKDTAMRLLLLVRSSPSSNLRIVAMFSLSWAATQNAACVRLKPDDDRAASGGAANAEPHAGGRAGALAEAGATAGGLRLNASQVVIASWTTLPDGPTAGTDGGAGAAFAAPSQTTGAASSGGWATSRAGTTAGAPEVNGTRTLVSHEDIGLGGRSNAGGTNGAVSTCGTGNFSSGGSYAPSTSQNQAAGGTSFAGGTNALGSSAAGLPAGASSTSAAGFPAGASSTGATASVCPGSGGPAMVLLPSGYCMDTTEVTRAQYGGWLATAKAQATDKYQIAQCSKNDSFEPNAECMSGPHVCQGSDCGDHPQVCVDWCDAYAYCKAMNKHLCGKVGGGSVPYTEQDTASSQWFYACTSGGQHPHVPYGYSSLPYTCNTADSWPSADLVVTTPVGKLKDCHPVGGYAGLLDIVGNAREWEDSCNSDDPVTAFCHLRGGDISGGDAGAICDCGGWSTRLMYYYSWGFRCCAL